MKIAVLALQGAFAEHQQMLLSLGAESMEIRNPYDWNQFTTNGLEGLGLIIPGGESTTMTRIMHDLNLWEAVRESILGGLAVFGTCAGMIMLDHDHLNTMDILVKRNAYGRQLGSFAAEHDMKGVGRIPMTFIRAPYIETVGPSVEVLSVLDGHIIAARQDKQLVCSFHPELTGDTRVHEMFLSLVCGCPER